MDWISGMQKSIDYMEEHILEDMDYEVIAAQSFSSSYHFQRVFSIVFGMSIGEYLRRRRLSLAGAELSSGNIKVIDAALKYGYESPDSFAKAFQKFHGILPSQVKGKSSSIKSFTKIELKISISGGTSMNYRIEEKPEMILTGFRTRFKGEPYDEERVDQEEKIFTTTRGKQWLLIGASGNSDCYTFTRNQGTDGYDYYICYELDKWERENLYNRDVTGVDFVDGLGFEEIVIPKATYVVFETKDIDKPIDDYEKLLRQRIDIVTEWMPSLGFELADAQELIAYHWNPKAERCVQIWLPIKKK